MTERLRRVESSHVPGFRTGPGAPYEECGVHRRERVTERAEFLTAGKAAGIR